MHTQYRRASLRIRHSVVNALHVCLKRKNNNNKTNVACVILSDCVPWGDFTDTCAHSGWQVPLNCSVNRYAMVIQCSLLFKHTVRILLNAPIWLWGPEWATNSQGHRTGVTIITVNGNAKTHTHTSWYDILMDWVPLSFFLSSLSWSERVLMFSGQWALFFFYREHKVIVHWPEILSDFVYVWYGTIRKWILDVSFPIPATTQQIK